MTQTICQYQLFTVKWLSGDSDIETDIDTDNDEVVSCDILNILRIKFFSLLKCILLPLMYK